MFRGPIILQTMTREQRNAYACWARMCQKHLSFKVSAIDFINWHDQESSNLKGKLRIIKLLKQKPESLSDIILHDHNRAINYIGFQNLLKNPLDKKIYRCFAGQRSRCYELKNISYEFYGAKGIEQEHSWEEFYAHIYPLVKDLPLRSWSIGRIDHSKNYSISNIEVQTKSENSKERIRRLGTPHPRKKIIQLHDDGSVTIFGSQDTAAKILKCSRALVHRVVEHKQIKNKFRLRLLDDYGI